MKCLNRNRQLFFCAEYESKTPVKDEYGNQTGEYELHYGLPKPYYGNISAAKGEMAARQFGEAESYDRIIVMDGRDTQIDEYSRLWVDERPVLMEGDTVFPPHDYEVKKVARSLNSISIAIRKVDVS